MSVEGRGENKNRKKAKNKKGGKKKKKGIEKGGKKTCGHRGVVVS